MKNHKNNIIAIDTAKKILADKSYIREYLKGKVGKEVLDERGIKLVMTI